MLSIDVTDAVFHLDRSPLNVTALLKVNANDLTLAVSHRLRSELNLVAC